jgi:hypothetical protein
LQKYRQNPIPFFFLDFFNRGKGGFENTPQKRKKNWYCPFFGGSLLGAGRGWMGFGSKARAPLNPKGQRRSQRRAACGALPLPLLGFGIWDSGWVAIGGLWVIYSCNLGVHAEEVVVWMDAVVSVYL